MSGNSLVVAADAAARWFRQPAPAALSAARTARVRALGAVDNAGGLSFALREAVESVTQAVSDAARWDLGADPVFATMADALGQGAKALERAERAPAAKRAEGLIEAKRWAADVERRRRVERAAARESPFVADSVKRREIADRFSAAAEALQEACDILAGSLAG